MKKHMKRLASLILAAALTAAIAVPACAYEPTVEDQAYPIAQALNEAGLFNGTGTRENGKPEFDLSGTATRAQAIVMLVRILGKEEEAKEAPDSPFADVPDWARSHVNYAYAHGLTNGTSAEAFGSSDSITNTQYLTFCLRALGYGNDDFQWDKAYLFARELGLIEQGEYENSNDTFKRADVVLITYSVMNTPMKDSTQTLAEHQGITLREVSRGTLPITVAERITVIDENTVPWSKNQREEPVFGFYGFGPNVAKFGTIYKGLTEYELDMNLSPEDNFKRLEAVYNSYHTNAMVKITKWKNGSVSFNVAGTPQGSVAQLPGITYYKPKDRWSIYCDMPANWGTGIPLDYTGKTVNCDLTVFLNTLCFADYDMGQQVFMMMVDYYTGGTAKMETRYTDEDDITTAYHVFSGNCTPITKEFVEKYGLTYVSGEAATPWLNDRGLGTGNSEVTVTNGIKTWTIQYCTPNQDNWTECIVVLN